MYQASPYVSGLASQIYELGMLLSFLEYFIRIDV